MKAIPILIAILCTLSLTIYGQTQKSKDDEQPYIEVTGTAEKEVVPDEIYISITIREKYAGKNKMTIGEQEGKLKNAIQSLGINLDNLYLADANADYVWARWTKKDLLTQKEYTLKVKDAETLGKVFEVLEKLEITDASVARVSHSLIDSLRKEVRIMAIRAAKDKADYLLDAIGEQSGKPLVIRETETAPLSSRNLTIAGVRGGGTPYIIDGVGVRSQENTGIEFRKIIITSALYIRYAIK